VGDAIRWEGDLTDQLNQFGPRVKRAMVAAAKMTEAEAEAYMKSNAPWTDQTGNARNGLKAQTIVGPNVVAILLYHQVPYGIYLELRWSGRYAIIVPTIEMFAPIFAKRIGELAFDRRSA
jgi:hypothetical protein